MINPNKWPLDIGVSQVRIARPTDKLEEVIKFYNEFLGLEIIASFKNHNGYDGVMFGLPSKDYHLEFTSHKNGSPCPAPTKDNLLVFYIPKKSEIAKICKKLNENGIYEVSPENPYWENNSVTFEDPDGWRIVFYNGEGL